MKYFDTILFLSMTMPMQCSDKARVREGGHGDHEGDLGHAHHLRQPQLRRGGAPRLQQVRHQAAAHAQAVQG